MKNFSIPFLVFACSSLLLIIFFSGVIADYFPSGDEISLIIHSCRSYDADILKWFSNGFYGYFVPYPEWNDSTKTILRPAVNFVFFVNDIFFKDNYGLYLLSVYFIHSISCASVFIICAQYLKLRYIFCYTAALLMFINPAVTNKDFFFHPGFVSDALAGVCFFLCFYILTKEKKYFFILFIPLVLALLTKEISILLCLLIPVTLYIRFKGQSFRFILSVLTIFIIYSFFRSFLGFETFSDSSLNHFNNVKELLLTILKGILVYPAGFYSVNEISQFYKGFYFSDITIIISIVFFLIPEILSISIGYILMLKRKLLEKYYANQNLKVLYIWSLFILLYLMLMGLDLRFAYSFYLFFIPLLFSLFKLEKKYKVFAALFLFCFLISNIMKFTAVLTSNKEENLIRYGLSRQLTEEFKKVENDFPVLLINDVSALFGSNSLSRFCGKKNELIKINSLDLRGSEDRYKSISEIRLNRDSVFTMFVKNINKRFLFEGVNQNFNHAPGVEFKRNDSISYFFPKERLEKITSKGKNMYEFGTSLYVKIKTDANMNVMYFDESETKYSLVKY